MRRCLATLLSLTILLLHTAPVSAAYAQHSHGYAVDPTGYQIAPTLDAIAGAPDEGTYCQAVDRFLQSLRQQLPTSHWQGSYKFPGATVKFVTSQKNSHLWNFSYFDGFVRADVVESEEVRARAAQPGHGLPLVAWRAQSEQRDSAEPFLPRTGLACSATAVVDVKGSGGSREATVRFYDTSYYAPGIAADVTAPIAAMLNSAPEERQSVIGFLRPAEQLDKTGLMMLEPYRHDKVPVVMVHGLNSLPRTWTDMCNELRSDPNIRDRFQFWFFRYPTGVPVPLSAAMLRNSLNSIRSTYDPRQKDRNFDQMVVVGHSMGGLLARLMVTDSGDNFWSSISNRSLDETVMTPEDRELLKTSLYFKPQPYVKRVVFIATPHRGSDMAGSFVGNLARRMVQMPGELTGMSGRLALYNVDSFIQGLDFPTSIDNLKPTNRFLQVLQAQPIYAPYHSIIGSNGYDNSGQGSTDGVVPYWSSHLEGAQSELVVQSDHSAHNTPAAIAELQRILYAHLSRKSSATTRRHE